MHLRVIQGGMSEPQSRGTATQPAAEAPAQHMVPPGWDEVEKHKATEEVRREEIRQAGRDRRHARTMQLVGGLAGAVILLGGVVALGHFVDRAAATKLLEVGGYLATGLGGWLFRGYADRRALPAPKEEQSVVSTSPG